MAAEIELSDHRNPGGRSGVMPDMRARALRAALVAAIITAAVVRFLVIGFGGADSPPRPQNTIEHALTDLVADRFGVGYVGRCPEEFPADGQIDWGVCSARLTGVDGRVVYRVGHPFSEWVGKATLVRDLSGAWHVVRFEEYPPLGD
ncbi:MAG TPA: hypothetical protein VFM81_01975 [Actinomycetota bacterium]|nr:hypothetical protein [Actinomycetota bacterium]